MAKLQPKKICNGGECERKHEVVNQTEKEQNLQGAGNILKRSFLEKTKKNYFLGNGQKKDKTMQKEKELEGMK